MATRADFGGLEAARSVKKVQAIGGIWFDWVMGILSIVFVGGLYLDGWAHAHGLVDKTFFTPWHAVLYTGFLANAVVLLTTLIINHTRGYAWQRAMPTGYELSLLGAPLFLIAGVGDLIWHTLFGFELGIETLLSPTHLLLAFSGILITSGPLRAAWRRSDAESTHGWVTLLPMLLSLAATFSVFTFFTEFAHPFTRTWTATNTLNNAYKSLGVAGILLQAGLLIGFILLALRRWRLPPGALTLIFTLNATLMSVLSDQYRLIPAVLLAGLVADFLLWRLKPSAERPAAVHLFAFAVPTILYLFYFLTLMLTSGITWRIHLWLGSTVMAGIVGLVLSYVLVPPMRPAEQHSGVDDL